RQHREKVSAGLEIHSPGLQKQDSAEEADTSSKSNLRQRHHQPILPAAAGHKERAQHHRIEAQNAQEKGERSGNFQDHAGLFPPEARRCTKNASGNSSFISPTL